MQLSEFVETLTLLPLFTNPPRVLAMFGIGTTELLIFLVIVTLLFGSARLPSLMRNLGRSAVEFKKGMRDDDSEPSSDSTKST